MKKYLLGLLLMVMFVPAVFAATSITVTPKDSCLAGEDICETEVSIWIETDQLIPADSDIVATLEMAEGVSVARTENSEFFTVEHDGDKIIFTPKELFENTDKVLLGKVVFSYASNIEDCSVKFSFKAYAQNPEVTISTGKPTQTGVSMPLAIISVISVLGIGAYLVSKRNTKFYKV